jgi:hypothetical protein
MDRIAHCAAGVVAASISIDDQPIDDPQEETR